MKRDESLRSVTQFSRRDSRRHSIGNLNPGFGWRANSLTISALAQHSAYLTEKANEEADQFDQEGPAPVSCFKLLRFATIWEIVMMAIGGILASINGLFVPIGVIIYGEFTALLIDRTVMKGTSAETLTISMFGGGRILTNASPEENRKALIEDSQAFGIGCTVFSILQFIFGAISVDLFNYAALKQIERVKDKFLQAVLRQDITWYDLNTTMNFATKVSDDVEKYREGIGEKVPMLLYLVTSFIFAVVISFCYGWELTLVILSCTPIVIATTAVVAKVQATLTTQELKAYSVAGVIAEEVLSSIRTVVAFGGEEKEIKRYEQRLLPAKKMGSKKGVYSGIGSGVMWLIIYATYALAFWYGVGLILESRHEEPPVYTPAVLMIVFFSVLQGAQNVGLTAPHMEAINNARASAAAIFSVMDRKPVIDSLSDDGATPHIKGDLELNNVTFRYPARNDVQVLNGLNLKISQNETVALVGSSGCGKSTVLQLLQRMYDPDSGSVTESGNDYRNMNVRHLRSHIAVVGQEPVLFAGSIKENIQMSNPSCTEKEIIDASKQAYCHDFIKNYLKLSTVLNATRIVFIDKGVVMEQGTHEELMVLKGRYYNLVLENEPHIARLTLSENADGSAPKPEDAKQELSTQIKIEENGNDARFHRPKPAPLSPQMSIDSIGKDDDSVSECSLALEDKEEEELNPTTWQIMKLCEPEKWLMLAGVLAAIVVGSSFPTFAVLFGETYGLFESPDEDWVRGETNVIAVLFLLVGVGTGIGVFLQIYIFNLTGVRLTARLRVAAFKKMLWQEIGWFDHPANGVGSLCARLAADAAAVQGATGTRIGALMQATATIVIGITFSMYLTWKMTLVSLVSVPMVIGAVVLEGRVLAAGLAIVRVASYRATTIATEAITNIRTVSAFCGEKNIMKRYREAGTEARRTARQSLRYRGCVFSFGQTAPVAGYALSLWYGGVLVANQEVHYKNVIKVSEALVFGAWMMGQALAFAPNFGAAVSAAGRVLALLERKAKIFSTVAPAVPAGYITEGTIAYKNIRFRYPTRREVEVLRGLSLLIPSGKRVALVGPSGCGKSTLIQLLQRLYDPDDGSVYLDSYSIMNEIRLGTLRRNLGLVSQEPVLFDRTIAENIAYGDNTRDVPIEEIVSAAKKANVHSFIRALPSGYDTRIGARASQLSGGQKQRIAIARALVRNPRVLLLDEATSALDTHSEKVVQQALDRASEGRTCLIIAHRLATIKNADIICVLDRGVVAEMGTHKELIALKGIYAKLYELQCGVDEEAVELDEHSEEPLDET